MAIAGPPSTSEPRASWRDRVRYLAFDLDGTVTDSAHAIAMNYRAVFRHFGLPEPPDHTVFPLIGLPLEDVLRGLAHGGDRARDADVAAWRDYYRAIYEETALPATTLFPGVRETLRRGIDLGYVMNVATSKQRGQATMVLDYCGVRDLFTVIAGGDVAARPKPYPDMLQWLIEQLGCAPDEILMVGDTTFDLEMGRAAGTWTCGVTYGVHRRETLEACRPDAMIDRFEDVLAILDSR